MRVAVVTKSFRVAFNLLALQFLMVLCFSSCAFSQDLSTDEKVLEALNKGRENKLEKQDVCIERPDATKNIIVIGMFAHDRGCAFDSVFVKGKRFVGKEEATKAALNFFGWSKGDDEARSAIAMNWTTNYLLKFSHPLRKPTHHFNQPDTRPFQEPQVKTNKDRGIVVSLWVQQPAGMQPITYYDLLEFSYGNDGTLKGMKTIDGFTRSSRGY
jgi:hypothetical protein